MNKMQAAVTALVCGSTLLAGCSGARPQNVPSPGTFATPTDRGAVAVVVPDVSGSVSGGTDLLAGAQNKITELVGIMPVGGKVVVRAFNSNVTANCNEVVYTLPPQKNPDTEKQIRAANQADVPKRFAELVKCSEKHNTGGTELFGGLAETLKTYPDAELVEIYSDGCENTDAQVCDPNRLRDPGYPQKVLAQLPAALTPTLSPSVAITFHGVGRGTQLDAASVQGLRDVLAAWVAQTGASYDFQPN